MCINKNYHTQTSFLDIIRHREHQGYQMFLFTQQQVLTRLISCYYYLIHCVKLSRSERFAAAPHFPLVWLKTDNKLSGFSPNLQHLTYTHQEITIINKLIQRYHIKPRVWNNLFQKWMPKSINTKIWIWNKSVVIVALLSHIQDDALSLLISIWLT